MLDRRLTPALAPPRPRPSLPPRLSNAEIGALPLQPAGADAASFLILACDGVWDELSSEEAVGVVAAHVQSCGGAARASARDLEGAAERLKAAVLERAAENQALTPEQLRDMPLGKEGRRGYHDDITALVVFLGPSYARPDGAPPAPAQPKAGWGLW